MNTPQFDLSAMLSTPQQTAVQQIPCDKLHPYHNHKFELYSGERLEDMVASIKENGVRSSFSRTETDTKFLSVTTAGMLLNLQDCRLFRRSSRQGSPRTKPKCMS